MRPFDLLVFQIDDYHKAFIKECRQDQKNFKIPKVFEAYSWGYSNDFQLGYSSLNNERKIPRKIHFYSTVNEEDYISVKDI